MTEIYPFYRRSDFNPASPDTSKNIPADLVKSCGGRITTALEYFAATRAKNDPAGKHMDAGHEPYLASKEAVHFGTWPWVEVQDVGVRLTGDGRVVLDLSHGTIHAYPDTLIFWR